jgi:dTDP-4-amino-4,6-dideoxygalactose transaminase
MGIKVSLVSAIPNATAANNAAAVVAFDNDSSSAPSSFDAVRQYSNSKAFSAIMVHDAGRPFSVTYWRPVAGKETPLVWTDVANPSGSLGSVLFYAGSLTASTQYFIAFVDLYVEFRGRR